MPVDYAEPQKLADFKIEVLPANSNNPIAVKQVGSNVFTPVGNSSIVPINSRNSDLGKPSNLPPLQSNLRNEGQYRTIDLRPSTKGGYASPSYPQSNQIPSKISDPRYPQGVTANDVEGTAALGAFTLGIYDQLTGTNPIGNPNARRQNQREAFQPLDDLAYRAGRRTAGGAQDAINDAQAAIKKTRDEIWKNRPQFEIPKIKIPEWDIEFPEIRLPEFEIPPFPQPQPIPPPPKPKPPRPQPQPNKFKLPILCDCGTNVWFGFTRKGASLGSPYNEDLSGWTDGFTSLISGEANPDLVTLLPPGSQAFTSSFTSFDAWNNPIWIQAGYTTNNQNNSVTVHYTARKFNSQEIKDNGGYVTVDLPQFINTRSVDGSQSPVSTPWQVAFVSCDGCQPYPAPEDFIPAPPPPVPPEKDCCRMGCCPPATKIDYRLIKKLMVETIKEQKFSVDVPIVKCEKNEKSGQWEPKISYATLDFFATSKEQAEQLAQLHIENAKQASELCLSRNKSDEAIASLPLGWQIRNEGSRPQLVIQCAVQQRDANNQIKYGSAVYPITVPHWKGGINDSPKLPVYKKGNHEGILVLADNSRVTIHAANRTECIKIINALKPWIRKEMLKGSYFKSGDINTNILIQPVKPMYGRYFSTGQKNNKPDWRVDFP
ncbi:MAG: hypothetical protein KAF91_31110 [Nostoc sp. TH1S01]|nr:hypothetical protein [Nostoc sp. TH1S01]